MTDRVCFQILGPLQAIVQRQAIDIGGQRPQLVLAALLLEPDRVIPTDRLVAAVWDDEPPVSARTQIAIAVSQLRRSLRQAGSAPGVIETVRPGYRLCTSVAGIDALSAEQQIAAARRALRAGRAEDAAGLFRTALGLWEGQVLAGLDRSVIAAGALRWEELRLTVTEEAAQADLALGRHHELVGELMGPVSQHPFRERLRALLMMALVRAGRQSEALAVYRDGRRIITDELGLEPGRALRKLHEAILRDDPSMYLRPAAARESAVPRGATTCAGHVPRARCQDRRGTPRRNTRPGR